MVYCVAVDCKSKTVDTRRPGSFTASPYIDGNSINFFHFPKDIHLKKEWSSQVNRKDWFPNKSSCVCERHFRPEDFEVS